MQRFSACLGVVAMLLALLTAPLFHFHDRDDHDNPISLIHAHFGESEESDSHSSDTVEAPHSSHNRARWIDFFTFKAPTAVSYVPVDLSEKLLVPTLEEREIFVIPTSPRAHSPPASRHSGPRPPPTT